VLALAAVGVAAAAAAAGSSGAPPATVPAIRDWRPAPGAFRLRADARVVLPHGASPDLRDEGSVLARDLGVAVREARARPGDVALRLDPRDRAVGHEGYRLRVGRVLSIVAPTTAGVFYGGRTAVALLRGRRSVPRGTARDQPLYSERGLMIDVGRRFFGPAWLEQHIRLLAALKLNVLHLHLSDNEGFRIESASHPEAVTRPALSKADVRRLLAVAERHHVTIVPEIDMPGHLRAALRRHPELQLVDAFGRRQPDKLDVTLPAARRFAADLLDEYLPLFGGRVWHGGADEYLGALSTAEAYARYPRLATFARRRHGPRANGRDAVLDFVAFVHRRVRAAGKELRVWSDGSAAGGVLRLDPRVSVQWWEERASPTPAALVRRGHRVLNSGWWPLYYVTGGPLQGLRAELETFAREWRPWRFEGPFTARWGGAPGAPIFTLPRGDPRQLGAELAVWNDDPDAPGARESAVAAGIGPRLRILAERTWGSQP
jgi:hexosaminidase